MSYQFVDHVALEDDRSLPTFHRILHAVDNWEHRYGCGIPMSAIERGLIMDPRMLKATLALLQATLLIQVDAQGPHGGTVVKRVRRAAA